MDKKNVTRQDVLELLSETQTVFTEYLEGVKKWLDIAEPEEPKLRHGDYGLSLTDSHPRLYVYDNGIRWANQSYVEGHDCIPGNPILGNIFDDLKAMQGDVEEFEVTSVNSLKVAISIDKVGDVHLSDDEEDIWILGKDIPTLILNLRCMEATLKRKQNDT